VSGINYFGIQLSTGDHSERLRDALMKVKALVFPVEGVLCGPRLAWDSEGRTGASCSVRDAFAVREAVRQGLQVAAFSQERYEAQDRMLDELGISSRYSGISSPLEAYERFLAESGLADEDCACIAEDILYIPVLERTGLSVTPIDGIEYLRNRVTYISAYEGGKGCVREMVELILQQQGRWEYTDHCVV